MPPLQLHTWVANARHVGEGLGLLLLLEGARNAEPVASANIPSPRGVFDRATTCPYTQRECLRESLASRV